MPFNNPFSTDRAEHLGDKLHEFFTSSHRFEGVLQKKSLVIRGGRGSGKTMFLLYNSYFHKKRKALNDGVEFTNFLKSSELIGIHFRADTNFVTAFREKGLGEDEWIDLFGYYINIFISQRLCEIAIDINKIIGKNNDQITLNNTSKISHLLGKTTENFIDLYNELDIKEIELINYINNVGRVEKPIIIGQGYLFNIIASSILNHNLTKNLTIHFFIDEYENLLKYQQRYLNTFIKHPNPVVFDVGMRYEGFKTLKTLGDSETIDSPHDFNYFDIDELSDSEYEEFIVETCKKRFLKVEELKNLPKNSELLDIRYYLGKNDIEDELKNALGKIGIKKIKESLAIQVNNDDSILLKEENPIHLGIHKILLERGNSVKELEIEYFKYLKGGSSSKYRDWIHNNRNGLVYLLLKEASKNKLYCGFNTYLQLSSGIIRYFIELCETAFKNAYRVGFSFENPTPIEPKEQTLAANYVSRYKINDIDHYSPYSSQLKRFIILLGGIFERLHRDKKLSEPERNHFSTDYEKLSDEAKDFLKTACMYSCLQKKRKTKEKSHLIDSNITEFHLNHIYAPYFKISPRRIRRLDIPYQSLEILMLGDPNEAQKMANSLTKSIDQELEGKDQLSIF